MIKSVFNKANGEYLERELFMAEKEKKVTLQMIAEKAKVSVSTVSNVLAGKKGVGEDVRKQIIFLADAMGYQRVSLKNGKSIRIGILIAEDKIKETHSFEMNVYKWIVQEAARQGMMTVLEAVKKDAGPTKEGLHLFSDMPIQGILMIGELEEWFVEAVAKEYAVPVVGVDFYYVDLNLDFIIADNYRGMYEVTRLLVQAGHKTVAFVGVPSAGYMADRYMGYQKALFLHGLQSFPPIADEESDDGSGGLMLPEVLPAAFACSSENAALMLLEVLEKRGLHAPEDVSLAVFGPVRYELANGLKLTVYENDEKAMAEISINTMRKRIEKKDRPGRIRTVEGTVRIGNSIQKRGDSIG